VYTGCFLIMCCVVNDRGAASGHQYEPEMSCEHGSGNTSVNSYRGLKFKSTHNVVRLVVSMMHQPVKCVGQDHRRSSHWSMYLTSRTYWFLVPAISLCDFCSVTFHPGCRGVVRQALSWTSDRSWS
jgi:hypothetical protein